MKQEERQELKELIFLTCKVLFKFLECIGMFYVLFLTMKHLIHEIIF